MRSDEYGRKKKPYLSRLTSHTIGNDTETRTKSGLTDSNLFQSNKSDLFKDFQQS